MLFYGKSMIYVGCLLSSEAQDKVGNILLDLSLSKPKALVESWFPGAMTYAEPLKSKGITHLADFKSSPQRMILSRLCDALVCRGTARTEEGTL